MLSTAGDSSNLCHQSVQTLVEMCTGSDNTMKRPIMHSLLVDCMINGLTTHGNNISPADAYFTVAETLVLCVQDIHIELSKHRGCFRNKSQKFAEIIAVNLDLKALLHLMPVLLRFMCETLKSLELNFANGSISVERLYRTYFQGVICLCVYVHVHVKADSHQISECNCRKRETSSSTTSCFPGGGISSFLV